MKWSAPVGLPVEGPPTPVKKATAPPRHSNTVLDLIPRSDFDDVHQLKECKGRDVETKCGLNIRVPKGTPMYDVASIWWKAVTCEDCRR